MEVTCVRLRLVNQNRLRAIASITLDNEINIDDIKIIQAKNRMCIMYAQNKVGQYIVAPTNPNTSRKIESAVLECYKRNAQESRVDYAWC
ncbi:septation protein SpoVG family protein [Thermocaproicibacter melissae]|uniref:septation protein SpoVG family protein n=1 Tax=Thermocaproicibacter melissae TaxID=2966552 RepID=UPI0024B2047C|nr:septation protein SpoVG family protein [Thermocaproicibacter melissae]WBY64717.1 septation protein SpoVG family protein [Thermocaproicibacter melissae]